MSSDGEDEDVDQGVEEEKQERGGALTEDQQCALSNMRDSFVPDPIYMNTELLTRFLRARKWDCEAAVAMLRACIAWRRDKLPVHYDTVKSELRKGIFFPQGFDKLGRPIMVCRVHLMGTVAERDIALLRRCFVYCLEYASYLCPASQEKVTLLCDQTGCTKLSQLDTGLIKMLAELTDHFYPDRFQLIIYPCSLLKRVFWLKARRLFAKHERRNVRVLSSPKEVLRYVNPEHLPESMGGSIPLSVHTNTSSSLEWTDQDLDGLVSCFDIHRVRSDPKHSKIVIARAKSIRITGMGDIFQQLRRESKLSDLEKDKRRKMFAEYGKDLDEGFGEEDEDEDEDEDKVRQSVRMYVTGASMKPTLTSLQEEEEEEEEDEMMKMAATPVEASSVSASCLKVIDNSIFAKHLKKSSTSKNEYSDYGESSKPNKMTAARDKASPSSPVPSPSPSPSPSSSSAIAAINTKAKSVAVVVLSSDSSDDSSSSSSSEDDLVSASGVAVSVTKQQETKQQETKQKETKQQENASHGGGENEDSQESTSDSND